MISVISFKYWLAHIDADLQVYNTYSVVLLHKLQKNLEKK